MTADLQTQIHDYAGYFGSTLPGVDLDAIIAETGQEGLVETSPQGRPRWLVTVVAAATVLVLIGIAAVVANLFGDELDPVIDSPTTTTPPVTTSTVPPGPAFESLPSTFLDSNGVQLGEVLVTNGVTSVDPAAAGVLEFVTEELLSDPRFGLGDSRQEREQRLLGCVAESSDCTGSVGGLRIQLVLDWDLQLEADRILDTWLRGSGTIGSIVMIENETGAIRVAAPGSLRPGDDRDDQPDSAASPLEPAMPAQAGSAGKLFPLVAALESGIGLNSMWDISNSLVIMIDGAEWIVRGGRVAGGERSLEVSTYFSTNPTFAQIGVEVGPEAMAEVAYRLGVTTELPLVYSLALGAGEVTQLDMAAAYSTIANYGQRVQPHFVQRIDDTDGSLLYEAVTAGSQVIDAALAAAVVNTLEKVVTLPAATGNAADIGRPQAGKTGSNTSFTSAWFVGFTPGFTTAVWVGTTDDTPMTNININGENYSRVFGGTAPTQMWGEFMTIALEDIPVEQFPPDPEGTEAYYSTQRPTGE